MLSFSEGGNIWSSLEGLERAQHETVTDLSHPWKCHTHFFCEQVVINSSSTHSQK